jgi:hypothetical protein
MAFMHVLRLYIYIYIHAPAIIGVLLQSHHIIMQCGMSGPSALSWEWPTMIATRAVTPVPGAIADVLTAALTEESRRKSNKVLMWIKQLGFVAHTSREAGSRRQTGWTATCHQYRRCGERHTAPSSSASLANISPLIFESSCALHA